MPSRSFAPAIARPAAHSAIQLPVRAALRPAAVGFPAELPRFLASALIQGPASSTTAAAQRSTRPDLQTKLSVNKPGDSYEQEADRVADHILTTPAQSVVSGSPPRIQRFMGKPNGQTKPAPVSVDQTLRSSGRPLEPALRQDMERRFGHNFSRVQVHSDAAAERSTRDLEANAYTIGHHIAFAAGRFAPDTREGRRLIAHELTHVVQQAAGVGGPGPLGSVVRVQRDTEKTPLQPVAHLAVLVDYFLSQYYRRSGMLWNIKGVAKGLDDYLEQHPTGYAFIRAVVEALPSKFEDNIAAEFVGRLPTTRLNVLSLTAEGRALMDVLYEAIITGDVSAFQRKQTERILEAKKYRTSQAKFLQNLDRRMIFPIRNIGVLRQATATFRAERLPNGNVKVRYSSVKLMQFDMFKADRETLPPWSKLRDGIELDPEQMVAVRLHDEGGTLVDLPALGLLDYSNQIQNKTISTASTAFFLGLTLGAGALGGGAVRALQVRVAAGEASQAYLWGMRALLWADRIAWAIPAGSMIINSQRDWIVKTFPNAGPALLDAVDTANRVAGYYGWGRLGIGTIRYLSTKVRNAVEPWRQARAEAAKRSDLSAADHKRLKAVEDEADALAAELSHAEQTAVGASGGNGQTSTTITASPPPPPSRPPTQTLRASPPPPPVRTSRGPAPVTDAELVARNVHNPSSIKPQDPSSHQKGWVHLGGSAKDKAPPAYRDLDGNIRVSTDHKLLAPAQRVGIPPVSPMPPAPTPPRVASTPKPPTPTPSRQNIGTAETGQAPSVVAPDPLAQTPPVAPPTPAVSRSNIPNVPVARDAPTGGPVNQSQRPPAPRSPAAQPRRQIDPPQAISVEGVRRHQNLPAQTARKGRGNNVNYSVDADHHLRAWPRLGGHGKAPPAFIYDGQVYLDPSRWPPRIK